MQKAVENMAEKPAHKATLLSEIFGDTETTDAQIAVIRLSLEGFLGLQEIARKVAAVSGEDFIALEFRAPSGAQVEFIRDTEEDDLLDFINGSDGSADISFRYRETDHEEKIEALLRVSERSVVAVKNEISSSLTERFESDAGLLPPTVVFTGKDNFVLTADFKHSGGTLETSTISLKSLEILFE